MRRRELDVNQDPDLPLSGRQGPGCGRKIFNILGHKNDLESSMSTHAIFTELNKCALLGRVIFYISRVVGGSFVMAGRQSV